MLGTEQKIVRIAALGNLTAALVDAMGQYCDDLHMPLTNSGDDVYESKELGMSLISGLERVELVTNGGLRMVWGVDGGSGQSSHTHSRQQAMVNRIVCAAMMTLA